MSVLDRIAHFRNSRDDVPNQELARELAERKDREGIGEIARNLRHEDRNVQSDCLKVLYEIGYLDPALIAGYTSDFLKLLESKNNRLVWGGMIALATVAGLAADEIYRHRGEIERAVERGSVITQDNGVKALARAAAKKSEYGRDIFPYLLRYLAACEAKSVPQHAEQIVTAIDPGNKADFVKVLEGRMTEMGEAQAARLKKVLKDVDRRVSTNHP